MKKKKIKFVVLPPVPEQRNEVIKFKLVAAFKTQPDTNLRPLEN